MKAKNRIPLRVIGAAITLALSLPFGNVAIASTNSTAMPAVSCNSVAPVLMYGDVIDTYLCYTCPYNISSHYKGVYNATYKQISFKHGYKVSGNEKLSSWSANVCGCGDGTVVKYKRYYMTY